MYIWIFKTNVYSIYGIQMLLTTLCLFMYIHVYFEMKKFSKVANSGNQCSCVRFPDAAGLLPVLTVSYSEFFPRHLTYQP